MSDGNSALPVKQDVARALLGKGSLFVHLDPRHAAVQVPTWLRQQPQLVLQVGYQMTIPIVDLQVDEEGVYGTLSFSRNPFTCLVPWEAVFALVGDDGRGMVWPESMPEEIAAEVEREATRAKRAAQAGTSDTPEQQASRPVDLDSRESHKTLTRIHEADDSVHSTPLLSTKRRSSAPTPPAATRRESKTPQKKRATTLPPYLRVVK